MTKPKEPSDSDSETKILPEDVFSRRDRMLAFAKNATPPLSPDGIKLLHSLQNNFRCLEDPAKFLKQLTRSLKELKTNKLTPSSLVKVGIDSIALASYVFPRYRDLDTAISGIRKIFEIILQFSPS